MCGKSIYRIIDVVERKAQNLEEQVILLGNTVMVIWGARRGWILELINHYDPILEEHLY